MVTLKDIAEKIGVSPTIISHVLNQRAGRVRVSEAKRAQILETARELGYVPNRSARTLVTRLNRTLGLLVNERRYETLSVGASANIFHILDGINAAGSRRGYRTIHGLSDLRNEVLFDPPGFLLDCSVDATVISGYIHNTIVARLKKIGLPLLHIGTNIDPDSGIFSISADMIAATQSVLSHAAAASLSAVHLYLPQGPGPAEIAKEFLRFAKTRHPRLIVTAKLDTRLHISHEEAVAHGQQLAASAHPPQLILTSISNYAPLLIGLNKGGLASPGKVEIIVFAQEGYINQPFGDDGHYVSQIVLPFRKLGETAALQLIDHLEGKLSALESSSLPCQFFLGHTSPSFRTFDDHSITPFNFEPEPELTDITSIF